MRIGSMFARGSCGALKWATLLGVVFALGAGSASAQIERKGAAGNWTLAEGETMDVEFTVKTRTADGFAGGTLSFLVFHSGGDVPADRVSTIPRTGLPSVTEGNSDVVPGGVSQVIPANATGADVDATWTLKTTLLVNPDLDAEDEIGTVRVSTSATATTGILDQTGTQYAVNSGNVNIGLLTITDRHEQTFVWVDGSKTPAASIIEGGAPASVGVTLRAVPTPTNYVWAMNARTSDSSYPLNVLSRGNIQIENTAREQRIVLDPATSDGDREDTEVTLTLYHAGTSTVVDEVTPEVFEFVDIHKLPKADKITWKAYGSKADGSIDTSSEVTSITEGGDPAHVRVTVDRGTTDYPLGEDIEVNVMAGEGLSTDYRTEDTPLTFADGASDPRKVVGTFRVFAQADNDIAMEELVLNLVATGKTAANGSGEVEAEKPVMLTITDETTPLLTAVTNEELEEMVDAARMASAAGDGNDLWTPGEMFNLDGDDLFDSDSAVQVAATSSSGAVGVSTQGSMVMLEAMEVGTATVTITGTVLSSFTSSQTVDNIASVEFDLEVEQLPLAITLSGPDDMNLAEGRRAMVTATANRAVTADTRVELNLVDGSGSPADYSVEPIMIMSGQTTGTTMLMATEDGMEEAMETLTFEGTFGSGMKTTNQVTFNIWDAAVPALPIIAQLLLAAFLAVGGYRRYLRRR